MPEAVAIDPAEWVAACEGCNSWHPVEAAHVSPTQGQIYVAVCPVDGLSDYWTVEGLWPKGSRT